MKISYSILTHNETDSLQELIDFIQMYKDENDEIVILDDYSDSEETKKILDAVVSIYGIKFEQRHLLKDYASQKNHLKNMCSGDYIFNLDADELTEEHINKWGWQVNEKGWVNWPDYQGRIWRNRPNIMWKNKVHEVLMGYKEHTYLPAEEEFCFYHPKTIDKQERQNKFYEGI